MAAGGQRGLSGAACVHIAQNDYVSVVILPSGRTGFSCMRIS